MPENEISEQDLYDLILRRLTEAGAEELANQTMQVVRRGTVIQGEEEAAEGKTKALRPMQPKESLAVALEFLITALQMPLMVDKAARIFECEKISWHADGPPDMVEPIQPPNSPEGAELPFADDSVEGPDTTETEDDILLREGDLRSNSGDGVSLMPIPLDFDLIGFQRALKVVIDLKEELKLRFPEVV